MFLRYPEAGTAKTRLIPKLGAEGAAALANELARHTLDVVDAVAAEGGIDVSLWYTGCDETRAREIAPGSYNYREQSGSDLGSRMNGAFESAFDEGYDQVALIGTDCPELNESVLAQAFDCLADSDLAIGPARDGGYYLIAMKAPTPALFEGIAWGTSEVLEATLQAAEKLGLAAAGLPLLWDVDRPEDLVDYELFKTRQAFLT